MLHFLTVSKCFFCLFFCDFVPDLSLVLPSSSPGAAPSSTCWVGRCWPHRVQGRSRYPNIRPWPVPAPALRAAPRNTSEGAPRSPVEADEEVSPILLQHQWGVKLKVNGHMWNLEAKTYWNGTFCAVSLVRLLIQPLDYHAAISIVSWMMPLALATHSTVVYKSSSQIHYNWIPWLNRQVVGRVTAPSCGQNGGLSPTFASLC